METFSFNYHYDADDGRECLSSTKTISGECLTHMEITEAYTKFLRQAGYFLKFEGPGKLVEDDDFGYENGN